MTISFKFTTTAIGSLPHTNAGVACDLIRESGLDIPFLPQLPKRDFREGMVTQFSERFPGIKLDLAAKKVWLETGRFAEELEKFYQEVMAQNMEYFAISAEYGAGLAEMLRRFREGKVKPLPKFLKGQVTGPVTFGLALTDETEQAVIHNEIIAEVVLRNLVMKALWQVEQIKALGMRPVIFIDEPSLMQFGSAFLPVNQKAVETALTELADSLHEADALAGLHCCGNTDWGMLLKLPLDIISFDAYGFMDKFALYTPELTGFLQRGGLVAWGAVPTDDLTELPNAEKLAQHIQSGLEILIKKGADKKRLLNQSVLTPACGLGALTESEAAGRLALLTETAGRLGGL